MYLSIHDTRRPAMMTLDCYLNFDCDIAKKEWEERRHVGCGLKTFRNTNTSRVAFAFYF